MKRAVVVLFATACLAGSVALANASRPKEADSAASAAATASLEGRTGTGKPAGIEKGWKLIAYYLHGTFRCGTCVAIERQSKEAIENDFAKEIEAGKVVFLSVNYEQPENAHFASDYQLMTRSLVLSLRKNGKEVKWKNLPAVWTHVRNPDGFRAYVSGEVRDMLKETK